jgi:hypothetical protein
LGSTRVVRSNLANAASGIFTFLSLTLHPGWRSSRLEIARTVVTRRIARTRSTSGIHPMEPPGLM